MEQACCALKPQAEALGSEDLLLRPSLGQAQHRDSSGPPGTQTPATQQGTARHFVALPLNLSTTATTSSFISERLLTVLCSSRETGSGIGALATSQLRGKQDREEL